MAVPKRKKSKSRIRMRKHSHPHRTLVPATGVCPKCGAPKELHRICPGCGFYAGRQALPARTED
jgi:large subunit ribosomal protein L32